MNPYFLIEKIRIFHFLKKSLKQGVITCKDEFDIGYINSCLSKFTHGYILLGSMRNGRIITSSADRYYLIGYVLFEYDSSLPMVQGKIICAMKNADPEKKIGMLLLNAVYSFILEKKVETWRILSLPYPSLVSYYESFGFQQYDTIYVRGIPKVIEMKLKIIYNDSDDSDDTILNHENDENREN